MKPYLFLFIGLVAQSILYAQDKKAPVYNNEEYTLVDDHIFPHVHDFYGYTFAPCQGKLDFAHYPDPVPAGWVKFTLNRGEVTILERTEYRPGGIQVLPNREKEYKLRITEIEDLKTSVTFKLKDPLFPDIAGHLYFKKDGYSRVTMIKYLPGPSDHERIYILKYATPEQLDADKNYFTHQEDFKTKNLDDFWGKTLYPFLSYRNYSDYRNISIKRLTPEDGYNINFFEKTMVTKNNKEKIMQYISFVENGEKKKQFLFKKATEVLVQHRDGNRKVLEIECVDDVTKAPYIITLHRAASTYLKSIQIQSFKNKERKTIAYYTMRRGKGYVPTALEEEVKAEEKDEPTAMTAPEEEKDEAKEGEETKPKKGRKKAKKEDSK